MKSKWIKYAYLLIGVGIIGLWIMLLVTNQIPEIETALAEIIMHIIIEVSMGILCIITAVAMIKKYKYSDTLSLLSNGMLIYSVVNSSGYYIQSGNYIMVVMFGVILVFALYSSLKIKNIKSIV